MRWFGAILAIGPVKLVLMFRAAAGYIKHTVFFTDIPIVLRRLSADDSSGMPQPRESRRRGSSEVPQAQVLSYPTNREKCHNDECDCVQPP
jgi:hypothetical protein